jgi:hypothetical protein
MGEVQGGPEVSDDKSALSPRAEDEVLSCITPWMVGGAHTNSCSSSILPQGTLCLGLQEYSHFVS